MPVPVSITDSLRTRPPEASNRSQSRSHTTRPPARCAERRDRVQPVDGQLAQTLKVRALAAEALQQERRVRDGELVPAVRIGGVAVGSVGTLSELLCHLAR